ncbi:MAG: SRPBCC family protein [Dehalococcoidia bacterium]
MATEATERVVQQAEVFIAAPPERVYAVISDVTRTGEWSPECRRCRWVGALAEPAVGARFRGYNRHRWLRWSRLNEVVTAEPGTEFAFRVLPDRMNKDSSIWRYRLEAADGGTRLSESTEVLAWPGRLVRMLTFLARRDDDMTDNIRRSLERVKAIVEAEGQG